MRWSVGVPVIFVSLFSAAIALADPTAHVTTTTHMTTTHGTIVKAPTLPPRIVHTAPVALPKAPPPPPAPPKVPATITLKTDGGKTGVVGAVVPGRNVSVMSSRVIVLRRQDAPPPRGPMMLATAITLPKK